MALWEGSKAQSKIDISGKAIVAGKYEGRYEMGLRGEMGQIYQGLDGH